MMIKRWLTPLRQRLWRIEESAIRLQELQAAVVALAGQNAQLVEQTTQLTAQGAELRAELTRLHTHLEASTTGRRAEFEALLHELSQAQARATWAEQAAARLHQAWDADADTREATRTALGRIEARQIAPHPVTALSDAEFQVFSQFGEDGILSWLLTLIPPHRRFFVEFGIEDYTQSNTRFLLSAGWSWSGLVLEGNPEAVAALRQQSIAQWHELEIVEAFITRENINSLLEANGAAGEIGVLSIDIDGNDYWVWEAITGTTADIVVIEFNYRFGPEKAVVVPYDPAFVKRDAHPSGIYFGASLAALCALGERKGYAFVGCSESGVNAFFVRRDRLCPPLRALTSAEGYRAGRHAELLQDGVPTHASFEQQHALLMSLPLIDLSHERT
jgi:hypothetical protein